MRIDRRACVILSLFLGACVGASDPQSAAPAGPTESSGPTENTGPSESSTETAGETATETVGETPTPTSETPSTTGPLAPFGADTPFTISLQRTACFGSCPMYVVKVDSQGAVTFEGQRFVGHTGTHRGTATAAAVAELRQALMDSNFFAMSDCYCERRITDLPSAIVTVEWSGQKKAVKHYAGDRSAPAALSDLQKKIDELSDAKRFIGAPTM